MTGKTNNESKEIIKISLIKMPLKYIYMNKYLEQQTNTQKQLHKTWKKKCLQLKVVPQLNLKMFQ